MSEELTHLNEYGEVTMVDVSKKQIMHRVATASATFTAAEDTIDKIMSGNLPKGEACSTARIAGIMAAKITDKTIPLCHSLPIEHVDVTFHRSSSSSIKVQASVTVQAKTGVEMEALSAVTTAALTLWDMTKAIDKNLAIENVVLLEKTKSPLT
tara:strand:+ start:89 stop:550 length:462 start_codon:yes stop_codon:yes gene_type:complete